MSKKSWLIAIRHLKTRGPALEHADFHKIAKDYIRAGVRGADLVQRVINSSGPGNPDRIRVFLKEHYPAEIEEPSVDTS